MDTSKLGNLSRRASYATANIEYFHAFTKAHHMRQIVLVSRQGMKERLAGRKAAKVERLSPPILIEVRRKIIIAARGCKQ